MRTAIEERRFSKTRAVGDSQFPFLIAISPKPVCHLFNLSIASAAFRRTSLVGVSRRAATRLEARRSGSCCRWCNSCRSRRTLASKSTGRSPSGVDALSLLQWPPAAMLAFLEGILPRRCGGRLRPLDRLQTAKGLTTMRPIIAESPSTTAKTAPSCASEIGSSEAGSPGAGDSAGSNIDPS